MTRRTQKQKVLEHLLKGYSITPLEALQKFGCFRLGAIIHLLRKSGILINTTLVANLKGNKYASYKLHETQKS